MKVGRLTRLYVAYTFARSAVFDKGVLALFLAAQGLSEGEVGLLQTILFIAVVVTEIPTGVLGDRLGRRISVGLGLICTALYAGGMLMADTFLFFAIVFVVRGLGRSFISGSGTALFYDAFKAAGEVASFTKIEARARAASGISLSIAMAVGGYVAEWNWGAVYVLYLVGCLVAMAVWAAISASPLGRAGDIVKPAKDQPIEHDKPRAKAAIWQFLIHERKGQSFAVAVLGMALMSAVVTPFYFFAQQSMSAAGLSMAIIGTIYGGAELLGSLVVLSASSIERYLPYRFVAAGFAVLSAASLLVASIGSAIPLLIGFGLMVFISPIFDIITIHFLHRRTPSSMRATVLSLASVVLTGCIAAGYSAYGFVAHHLGTNAVLTFGGIYALVILVVMIIVSRGGRMFTPYMRPRSSQSQRSPTRGAK